MHTADIRGYCIVGKVGDAYLIHLHTADERKIVIYLDDVNKNIVISNFKKLSAKSKEVHRICC